MYRFLKYNIGSASIDISGRIKECDEVYIHARNEDFSYVLKDLNFSFDTPGLLSEGDHVAIELEGRIRFFGLIETIDPNADSGLFDCKAINHISALKEIYSEDLDKTYQYVAELWWYKADKTKIVLRQWSLSEFLKASFSHSIFGKVFAIELSIPISLSGYSIDEQAVKLSGLNVYEILNKIGLLTGMVWEYKNETTISVKIYPDPDPADPLSSFNAMLNADLPLDNYVNEDISRKRKERNKRTVVVRHKWKGCMTEYYGGSYLPVWSISKSPIANKPMIELSKYGKPGYTNEVPLRHTVHLQYTFCRITLTGTGVYDGIWVYWNMGNPQTLLPDERGYFKYVNLGNSSLPDYAYIDTHILLETNWNTSHTNTGLAKVFPRQGVDIEYEEVVTVGSQDKVVITIPDHLFIHGEIDTYPYSSYWFQMLHKHNILLRRYHHALNQYNHTITRKTAIVEDFTEMPEKFYVSYSFNPGTLTKKVIQNTFEE